jgi:hypothetical protein
MKKLLLLLVVVAAGFYFGRPTFERLKETGTYKGSVRRRVTSVLDGWKKGGTEDTNATLTAACYWCKGMVTLSMDEMSNCTNGFDQFRREKELFLKIADFEVRDIEVLESTIPPTANVSLAIDGRPFRWRVRENEPIVWIPN